MGNQVCGVQCGPEHRTMEDELDLYRSRHKGLEISLDKLREMTKYYIQTRGIKPEDTYMVDQFISLNQVHIIEALRRLSGPEKSKLKDNINKVQFQQVDNLYFSTISNKDMEHQYRQFTGNIKSKLKLNVEKFKQSGLDLITNGQIAVIACFECFCSKNPQQKQLMCLKPTFLPSHKASLKLILERIYTLERDHNTKIPVFFIVDISLAKQFRSWIEINSPKQDVQVKVYVICATTQEPTIPLLSREGLILFKDSTSFIYDQIQGDILFTLKNLGILNFLTQKKIKFVHFINPDNLLERVCQPEMLGFINDNHLDVISKIVLTKNQLSQSQKDIYLVSSNYQETTFASWADLIPPLRQLKFIGSTMFRAQYLCKDLFHKYKNLVSKNMKCNFIKVSYYDPVSGNYVFDNQPNSLVITRHIENLIVGKTVMFWKVFPLEEDANIRSDPEAPTVVSNYFKSLLGITNTKESELVEISPLVSYDGKEGIQNIIESLKEHQTIGYPLLIQQ